MPIDCEVFQGSATITIEHLTGEVKPLETKVGDRIPGGARNLDGRMIVKVCLHLDFSELDLFFKKKNHMNLIFLFLDLLYEILEYASSRNRSSII